MAEPSEGADPATESDPTGAAKLPRWRRFLVGFLVVLVCVLAPISVLGVWVRNTVLHTDQYVDTMTPLASDPAIQNAVANRVTNTLIEETGLEKKISDLLPTKAQKLAPVITGGAEQVVHTATLKIVESDQFVKLWKEMNKRAHTQVVAVLQGNGTDSITTKNGQVVVHLGPVFEKVTAALSKAGIGLFDDVDATRLNQQIVLLDSQDLRKAQGGVDLLNDVANFLPFVLLAFVAIAIWLSGNRRRTIVRTSLGIALGMALMLILFNLGRSIYLDSLPSSVNQSAASAVYDQVLSFLRTALRTAFVLAIVVAIGAWLSGPGRVTTKIRERVRGATSRETVPGEAPSPVATFVDHYRNALRIVVVGIGLVILVVLDHPGPAAVLVIAVLVLIGLLVIELLGRNAQPASVSS